MRFPNAANGVKKIFTAEVLQLIAAIATLVATILGVITLAVVNADSVGAAIGAGAGTLILGIGAAVLLVIAFILTLVGIINASKDEAGFKVALIGIIISIVASVAASLFSSNATVQSLSNIINQLMQLLVTVFVIQSIIRLADQLNRGDISAKGTNLFKIMIAIYALILIANIVVMIFGGSAASVTAGIIALVAVVLSIVQYILYLSFLAKAKKMLAEG